MKCRAPMFCLFFAAMGCVVPDNRLRFALDRADLGCMSDAWPTMAGLADCEAEAERGAVAKNGGGVLSALEKIIAVRGALARAYDAGTISRAEYHLRYVAFTKAVHAEVLQQ